jgi:hypothetical protein
MTIPCPPRFNHEAAWPQETDTQVDMKETSSGTFRPGHPRFGGRKKGSENKRTREVREILERLNWHPVEFLATVAMTGQMPNPDGSFTPVDAIERLGAAKAIAPFCAPKLQAVDAQVNTDTDAPRPTYVLPTSAILSDPIMTDRFNELAMWIAQRGTESPRRAELSPAGAISTNDR